MNDELQLARAITRRHFLRESQVGLGALALASLRGDTAATAVTTSAAGNDAATPRVKFDPAGRLPGFGRAKNVIYLHMAGAPPQHELFDYKPKLVEMHMQPCPDEFMQNQRFPFIKGHPKLLGTPWRFERHGESGIELSELLPHLATMVDELAVVKSMHTDQFNHAPAELFLFTGSARFGGASMGAWATYGLGTENQDLPGYVVMVSGGTDPTGGKSLWGSGFLPSIYQGVQCRSTGDPVLYVGNPNGMDRETRRRSLDALRAINEREYEQYGDPETLTRISQYELAFRMQLAVPEVMDLKQESAHTLAAYGAQPGGQGFANDCLLARRLVERGVRFVQLFNWGWDMHGISPDTDISIGMVDKTKQVDRPIAALLQDLKQRGMLDETLVIWGGEFGRTSMNEARGGSKYLGRDHHPHCFTMWMAGGGVKPGTTLGETDELGYFITQDKMGIPDLQATMLHLLGLDPYRFSYPFQGLNQRLIGPSDEARIRPALLA